MFLSNKVREGRVGGRRALYNCVMFANHLISKHLFYLKYMFISHHSLSHSAGMDVTANQEEISNHETFQLEFDPKAAKWAIRTMQDKYFR